ncbi:MAG: DUF452 family protein [Alphaproteobacteria bacterium]
MKQYFIDNNSQKLIVFFAGWGCDENQFANLKDNNFNILIFFDYQDLNFNFDFSAYKDVYVVAYSAGGMISCVLEDKIPNIRKRVAVNSNPFLFDEKLGVPADVLKVFQSITMENYMEFRRQYMVFDEAEFELYNKYGSKRSLESCEGEYLSLLKIYNEYKNIIKPNFDKAIFADNDAIFNLSAQKEFFKDKIKIIPSSKHHLFFRFNSFEDMLM